MEGELRIAEEEVGHGSAPRFELGLAFFDEDVEGVLVLLDEAEEVDEFAAHLGRGLVFDVVSLAHGLLVGRGEYEGDVNVEVVGVLDAAHELLELVAEVLSALFGHHEVVLEDDGETLPHDIAGEGALGLREGACRGLVRDAGRRALVEGPDVPFELAVRVGQVFVREDLGGERGVGGVGDEAVDAIGEPLVRALEGVREVPAAMALVALQVGFDVARGGPEDVFVILDGGVGGVGGVGAAAVGARVDVGHVGWIPLPSAHVRTALYCSHGLLRGLMGG